MLVDLACHAQSIVPVPLYDTLGPQAVEYIAKHAELAGIACSARAFPTLAQCLPSCPNVKLVVRPAFMQPISTFVHGQAAACRGSSAMVVGHSQAGHSDHSYTVHH